MQDEYKKPYLHLFGAVSDVVERLERGADAELARLLLIRALREAEELYVEEEET